MNQKEIWKNVVGLNGVYIVSNFGRIARIRKPWINKNGDHKTFRVRMGGSKAPCSAVHRLVAFAFLGEPPIDKNEVNHKDGNPLNNNVENLEWCSRGENQLHAYRNGLAIGHNQYSKKL